MKSSTDNSLFCLLLLYGVSLLGGVAEAQKDVRLIEIHSGWGGLGSSKNTNVRIQRTGGEFLRNGNPVSATQVQALVTALAAAPIAKPDMQNLGVSPTWLNSNVALQHPTGRVHPTEASANQQELFNTSFTNPDTIAKVLPNLFGYSKSDDYPFVKVEVVFDDGAKLVAESHSYYLFMLPWKVDGLMSETYNAGISRAISALLPAKTTNKERLAGNGLISELVDAVMRSIETEWNLLGSDELAGSALRTLRSRYEVTEAEIGPWHHPEYGTATYKGEKEELNLHVTVRRSSYPPNVTDAVVLRLVAGKVEGVNEFLNTAAKYENLALSVPWLNSYIRENPRVPVRISYVHNQSLGNKAMRTFAEDMKARGRLDLIENVRARQTEIALLIIGNTYSETYWFVFPDKHMLLWRYGGASGLLKWTREDFGRGQCSAYENNYGGCSGREVTPDGTLAPDRAPRDQACMAESRASQRHEPLESEDLFPVMEHDRAGFIDRTGRVVIPLCFDKVGDFSEGLARFERDGSWGYIDTNGSAVIEPKFPWAQEFSEGLARVQITGSSLASGASWGFIDKTGKITILPSPNESSGSHNNIGSDESAEAFHDGLAKISIDRKTGYIDKAGNFVIPADFTYAYPFSEGLAAATQSPSGDDGWGYIDRTGKWVIAPQFEWGRSFNEHLAPVNRKHHCGYIDDTGAFVLQPPVSSGEKDCATVWGDFAEGLARWKLGNKYGFIDRSGKFVIKPRFDLTFHFSEGLAAVKVGEKWGYVDKTGKMVIQPRKLFHAEDFHRGLAFVTTEDRSYGYIDRTGKYVWTPTFLYKD